MLGRQGEGSGETWRACASPAGVRARIVPLRPGAGPREARAAKPRPREGGAGRWMRDDHDREQESTGSADEGYARCRGPQRHDWSWVEASVWTERMLSALDNGVKGGKWFSLIDKVFAPATLAVAWAKVRANKGAAGVDGQSVERFAAKADAVSVGAVDGAAGGHVPTAGRQAGGDPEGRWQDATAGHPDGQGSHRPAGGEARDRTDLRERVLRRKLRLPSGTRLPGRAARGRSADQGGLHASWWMPTCESTSTRSRTSG